MKFKKKAVAAVGSLLAAGAMGAAALAPMANADDGAVAALNAAAAFSVDVTNAGITNIYGPQQQLLNGIIVCNNLEDGYTPRSQVETLYANSTASMTYQLSGTFVWLATEDLCPWHFGQPVDASWPNAVSGGFSSPELNRAV